MNFICKRDTEEVMNRGRHAEGKDLGIGVIIESMEILLEYLRKLYVTCFGELEFRRKRMLSSPALILSSLEYLKQSGVSQQRRAELGLGRRNLVLASLVEGPQIL